MRIAHRPSTSIALNISTLGLLQPYHHKSAPAFAPQPQKMLDAQKPFSVALQAAPHLGISCAQAPRLTIATALTSKYSSPSSAACAVLLR
jgi:hypothetical protein